MESGHTCIGQGQEQVRRRRRRNRDIKKPGSIDTYSYNNILIMY